MNNKDIVYVTHSHVKCEGQEGDFGHPLVYLEIKDERIICPYCSRNFTLKDKK